MSSLTVERLKEVLDYDPSNGDFVSKLPRGNIGVGATLGCENGRGYKRVKIDGRRYMMHNLAWLYMTGGLPKEKIDHKDGDPSNNKWSNLRPATDYQNSCNKGLYKNNLLGIKGITKTRAGTYMVRVDHKSYGCFKDLELAELVVQEVRDKLHGEFARHG